MSCLVEGDLGGANHKARLNIIVARVTSRKVALSKARCKLDNIQVPNLGRAVFELG